MMEIIDLEQTHGNAERFSAFLDQVCARLGVDYAAYAGANPVSGRIHGFVNYPKCWKDHYVRLNLARDDPTLFCASRSIAPVDWSALPRDAGFRRIFREARDFGISENGLTVPVRGPFGDIGMLSVTRNCSSSEWDVISRKIASDLQAFAVHLHDTVMRSDELPRIIRQRALSAREREVLQWVAAGKTYAEVGEILSISDRTVEVHLRSAREKLSSLTTAQAVARAITCGLIYPR